jgi:hypothetical protein
MGAVVLPIPADRGNREVNEDLRKAAKAGQGSWIDLISRDGLAEAAVRITAT